MLSTLETSGDVVIMSPEEVRRMIDTEAQERLHLTGEQFIERWSRKGSAGHRRSLGHRHLDTAA